MSAAERSIGSLDRGAVIASLQERLAAISDGKLTVDAIDADAHLFDYGYVDSLTAVSFLAHVEEAYGVRIDDVEIVESCHTVARIADRILAGN
jgi:acyl carrier protein